MHVFITLLINNNRTSCSSALSFATPWISRAITELHTCSSAARSLTLSTLSPLVASLKAARKRATASFSPFSLPLSLSLFFSLSLSPASPVLNVPDVLSARQQRYGSIINLGNGSYSSVEHCLHSNLDAMVTAARSEEKWSSATACLSSCRW